MMDLAGPVTRIACRYLAGICLAKGLASHASVFSDPDFVTLASYGAAGFFSAVSEGGYYLARKRGWHR